MSCENLTYSGSKNSHLGRAGRPVGVFGASKSLAWAVPFGAFPAAIAAGLLRIFQYGSPDLSFTGLVPLMRDTSVASIFGLFSALFAGLAVRKLLPDLTNASHRVAATTLWAALSAVIFALLGIPALILSHSAFDAPGTAYHARAALSDANVLILAMATGSLALITLAGLPWAARISKSGGALVAGLGLTISAAFAVPALLASPAPAPTVEAVAGDVLVVPGGRVLIERVQSEHVAPMQIDKYRRSGMNMSAMVPDMTPDGYRRFQVFVGFEGTGPRAQVFAADMFTVTGTDMNPVRPIRSILGDGILADGELSTGNVTFQVPLSADEFVLHVRGADAAVALDPGPAHVHEDIEGPALLPPGVMDPATLTGQVSAIKGLVAGYVLSCFVGSDSASAGGAVADAGVVAAKSPPPYGAAIGSAAAIASGLDYRGAAADHCDRNSCRSCTRDSAWSRCSAIPVGSWTRGPGRPGSVGWTILCRLGAPNALF